MIYTCDQTMAVLELWKSGKTLERVSDKGPPAIPQTLSELLQDMARGVVIREKAEPELVPWTMDDVPDGCVLRHYSMSGVPQFLVVAKNTTAAVVIFAGDERRLEYAELLKDGWEYRRFGQTHWKPCGRQVAA